MQKLYSFSAGDMPGYLGGVKTGMGGSAAKYELSEVITGIVFPAFTSHSCGSWITAYKYRDMTIEQAVKEALTFGELSHNFD